MSELETPPQVSIIDTDSLVSKPNIENILISKIYFRELRFIGIDFIDSLYRFPS